MSSSTGKSSTLLQDLVELLTCSCVQTTEEVTQQTCAIEIAQLGGSYAPVDRYLKSMHSHTKSRVHFHNRSSNNVVTVWIDFYGKPVQYQHLSPGQSSLQCTYVTHPWIVVEVDSGHYTLMQLNGGPVCFPQAVDSNVDITSPRQPTHRLAPAYHGVINPQDSTW